MSAAHAAGYHYLRVDVLGGTTDNGVAQAGIGASLVSDGLSGFLTFGDPAIDGRIVKAGRLESSAYGPVIGYVPPAFRSIVHGTPRPWLLGWLPARVGGDAAVGHAFEADLAPHAILNMPGFFAVDPRHAYAGPSVGLGVHGIVWDPREDGPSATAALTGEGAVVAGVTLRDSWYLQALGTGRIDLFGDHPWELGAAAVTGAYLAREGIPLGLEVRGELDRGTFTRDGRLDTAWSVRTALFWKLAPEYQTKIEERIDRLTHPPPAR